MGTLRKALLAGSVLTVLTLAGCGSAAPSTASAPAASAATVTMTAPGKTITTTATPSTQNAPASESAPQPQFANASAVVTQFYQDITDHNYAAAWALGGRNVSGGVGYNAWVAGYGTTESTSLGTFSNFGAGEVQVDLFALQSDGTVRSYTGTYTVQNGIIVAAHIVQN
jgi:hypothetical protein